MASHKLCHLFLTLMTLSSAQRLFIDTIPAYSELPVCAENQLRTVVKNMKDGCGDGSRTTSYSCFCTDSSSHFSRDISTRVASACLPETTGAVGAAAEVFSSYCALGLNGTSVALNSTVAPATTSQTSATRSSITASETSTSRASLPPLPTETANSGSERWHHPRMYSVVLASQLAALLLRKL